MPFHAAIGIRAFLAAIVPFVAMQTASAGPALDRIIADKMIRIGVRTDAPPFAYLQDGQLYGFTVELCGMAAEAIVATSKLDDIGADIIAVQTGDRFKALQTGEIDMLCGATTVTLQRREIVSFSISTFTTGVGAITTADAPAPVRQVLVEGAPADFDKTALQAALAGTTIGFRANTTASVWLTRGPLHGIEGLTLAAFGDHAAGVAAVAEGKIAAYVADRAILLGVIRSLDEPSRFIVSSDLFTREPYALALPRGDEDLRLVVDRALSFLYRTGAILEVYERNFGAPDADVVRFYESVELPQ